MALELLPRCVMMHRSEKLWLVGAGGLAVTRASTRSQHLAVNTKVVVPLLNLFEGACV